MNKWIKISIAAAVGVAVFFAISIGTQLFAGAEIPIQVAGALLEAIVTAFITVILLSGQSSAEEIKERNVRVFEEKTNRYNKFIDALWTVWENKKISLEEISKLFKAVSKDIILYTNKNTADKILTALIEIAKLAEKERMNNEEKKLIQSNVFDIINHLAKDLNLGGEINEEMRGKLSELEGRVVPYLNIKDYKSKLIAGLNERAKMDESLIVECQVSYWVDGEYLFLTLVNTPVKLIVGPIVKSRPEIFTIIGFYIDYYQFPNFHDFRLGRNGWKKDILKGHWQNPIEMVDFNSKESVNKFIDDFHSTAPENNPVNLLFTKIVEFHNQWNIDGKSISEISEICKKE